jgi:hypothetical protein
VGLRKPCTYSNRHLGHGIRGLIVTCIVWDLQKSEADPNLYFILVGSDPLILVMYVEYFFITGTKGIIVGAK